MTAKCGNYAEVTGSTDNAGPGVFCYKAVGHKGLCEGRAEGYEHSVGRRMEANFTIRWVAREKKKAAVGEPRA